MKYQSSTSRTSGSRQSCSQKHGTGIATTSQEKGSNNEWRMPNEDEEATGAKLIAGMDEVGMGCLAGPLVVAVTAFEGDRPGELEGVRDSKKMSAKQREFFAPKVVKHATFIGVGWASAAQIDELGLAGAWQEAATMALEGIPAGVKLYIDGERLVGSRKGHQEIIVKGDDKVWQISAASVLAKVIRDHEMEYLGSYYNGYDWPENAGYGTEKHKAAILSLGTTPFHRKYFLRKMYAKQGTI